MGKLIAVSGCKVEITNAVSGDATITTNPSAYVKINGKGVYRGTLTISISGFQGSIISGGTGTGSISANALTTKVDDMMAVLEGATGTVTCIGTNMETGATGTPETAFVKISDAGQSYISEG